MRRRLIWLCISVVVIGTLAFFSIDRQYWGDERHFVETIRLFGSSPWPQVFADYPEVTPPLFYVLYAIWGKIFGFKIEELRIFSLLIAILAYAVLYEFVSAFIQNTKRALVLCLALLLNPYLWGLSVFVFTDMMTLLFVVGAAACFQKERRGLTAIFLGAGLLCRQYVVFVIAGLWAFTILQAIEERRAKRAVEFSAFMLAAMLPLLACVFAWGGIAPPLGRDKWIMQSPSVWNPHAFIAYVAFSAIYLIPVLCLDWRNALKHRRLALPALAIGGLYFIFPVQVSLVTQRQGAFDTVGLAHRAIEAVFGQHAIESVILYVAASLGFWILLVLLNRDIKQMKSGKTDRRTIVSFCYYAFLLTMPFSYQIWEKYLVVVLPFVAAAWFLPSPIPGAPGMGKIEETASVQMAG
jgi:4-amino-4-deoxy-L-arabinose transferase-like glycosyltransferase